MRLLVPGFVLADMKKKKRGEGRSEMEEGASEREKRVSHKRTNRKMKARARPTRESKNGDFPFSCLNSFLSEIHTYSIYDALVPKLE